MNFSFLDNLIKQDVSTIEMASETNHQSEEPSAKRRKSSMNKNSSMTKQINPCENVTVDSVKTNSILNSTNDEEASFSSAIDAFDKIHCPNTFEDNSQLDHYFDTHLSTPSPKLRRSKRRIAKNGGNKSQSKKSALTKSTTSKKSTGSSKTPPKLSNMKQLKPDKLATTPAPVHKHSLLKMALGNAAKQHKTPREMQISVDASKRRVGPRTSTPNNKKRIVVKNSHINKSNPPNVIVEKPEPSAKKPVTRNRTNATAKSSVVAKKSEIKKGQNVNRQPTASAGEKAQFVKPPLMIHRGLVAAKKPKEQDKQGEADVEESSTMMSTGAQSAKSISQRMAPNKPRELRRSLRTLVKSRVSISTKLKTGAIRGAQQMIASVQQKDKLAKKENSRPVRGQYSHVRSKVALMINSGPVVATAPKLKDMKTTTEVRNDRKPLHEKPFIPAGKVRHETQQFAMVPGEMTIGGQTMAQFCKNFHLQTPPRCRALKPGQRFEVTCNTRNLTELNPTIPKTPKFATDARLRKTALKR